MHFASKSAITVNSYSMTPKNGRLLKPSAEQTVAQTILFLIYVSWRSNSISVSGSGFYISSKNGKNRCTFAYTPFGAIVFKCNY